MNEREQRGLAIAALCKIDHKGGVWLVPSQSGKGRYTVCLDPSSPHCTCPDHETTGGKCKHIYAAEYAIRREEHPDGSETITETVTLTKTTRKTYKQNWKAYNEAQTHEKDKFQDLLRDLCDGVEDQPQVGAGRRRLPLGDAIFCACFKIFSTVSCRRFMCDLRDAQEKGSLPRPRTSTRYSTTLRIRR